MAPENLPLAQRGISTAAPPTNFDLLYRALEGLLPEDRAHFQASFLGAIAARSPRCDWEYALKQASISLSRKRPGSATSPANTNQLNQRS